MILTGKTKVLAEKRAVPVFLCPPQSSLYIVALLPHKRINTNFPVFHLFVTKFPIYTD